MGCLEHLPVLVQPITINRRNLVAVYGRHFKQTALNVSTKNCIRKRKNQKFLCSARQKNNLQTKQKQRKFAHFKASMNARMK